MGICFVNQDNYLPEDLYHKATVALSKCNNQYNRHLEFYDAESGAKTKQEQFVQNEMKNALLTNQFVLYYQPKFDLATETICGSEALVRWRHPERGLIQPGIFIPVFENNGFISKLDIYVWEETCKAIKKWTDEGRKVYPVSVNVSRVSLYNPNLTSVIKGIVDKYGIDISLFQLEITESAYMSNPQLMEATINSLRKEGFAILMDDFGSGYSSLNTLKSIFIDALKIDMKFLPFDKNQKRSKMILSCVIQMAKLLKIYVISEGVENVEQRDFLKENGCDAIQGYFYSRPIPEDEFEEKYLLKENEKK